MAINLKKGESINLSKREPNLRKIRVGLGWDKRGAAGADFDLDVSVFVCQLNAAREPKLISDEYFVFYNNKVSPDGAVTHSGDNRTGDATGDDESVIVDLGKINPAGQEISFVVTIHEADARGQNFGQIQNAYIRLYDNDKVVADYDLDEMFSSETAVQFGSFFKLDNEWLFKAVGAGYRLTLSDFVEGYQ
jgi:tellurium resistance protein TerD